MDPIIIPAGERHKHRDYTLATYDFIVALRAGDQAAMSEALNRVTDDDEFGSLQLWLDTVAPADDATMAKWRAFDLAEWEMKLRFEIENSSDE